MNLHQMCASESIPWTTNYLIEVVLGKRSQAKLMKISINKNAKLEVYDQFLDY